MLGRRGTRPLVLERGPERGRLGVLDERGRPTAQTPLPGLHFVGFTVTLGGLMRKVGIEARELAESLAA